MAVLSVALSHIGIPLWPGGGIGVDVFFVLSGFLITTLLLEERAVIGHVDYVAFYQRRALRLFPALALMVPCVALAAMVAPTVDPETRNLTLAGIPWVLLYAANWAR